MGQVRKRGLISLNQSLIYINIFHPNLTPFLFAPFNSVAKKLFLGRKILDRNLSPFAYTPHPPSYAYDIRIGNVSSFKSRYRTSRRGVLL
jgi:hypothetical protein